MRFLARQARSVLTFVVRRVPAAFTLADRLFTYRSAYREPGDYTAGFDRVRLELLPLEARALLSGTPVPNPVLFTAAGGQVDEYAASAPIFSRAIEPFAGCTGPLNLATGDLDGDGFPDLVAAEGAGGEPLVSAFDGITGDRFAGTFGGFMAFEPSYTGGVQVAVADVNGDGVQDIIAAAQRADGPEIRVFSGANGAVLADFTVTGAAFASGFSLAAGDFTGSGQADVVVGGTGGWVSVYDPLSGTPLSGALGGFQVFGSGYTGGVVSVAADPLAGTVNPGATSELAVATGAGPVTEVKVLDASGTVLQDLEPFGASDTAGAQAALAYISDPTAPTVPDVVAASGPGDADTVLVFNGATGAQLSGAAGSYAPFGSDTSGATVAASNDPGSGGSGGSGGTGSVGTYVWFDTNDDGIPDDGESGASGVTVSLLGGGYGVTVNETTVTDSMGHYDFTAVPPGIYVLTVEEPAPGGYTFTYTGPGTVWTMPHAGSEVIDFGITAGEVWNGGDVGLYNPDNASIGTRVWFDTNDDGIQETSEYGASAVTVTLTGGTLTAAETAITDASGDYDFPDLAPGTYTVSYQATAGYGFSTPSGGVLVQTVTNGEVDTAATAGLVDAQTTTTLVANPVVSTEGEDVALTATVTPAALLNHEPPGGLVTFTDAGVTLGTAALDGIVGDDQAVLTTDELPLGTSTVTATYGGGAGYESSHGTTAVTVTAAPAPTWGLNAGIAQTDPALGGYLLSLGEAQVDLNQGAVRVSQALDFAQSDFGRGTASFALVYNGATVQPLVVMSQLRTNAASGTPSAIYATLIVDGTAGAPVSVPLTGYVAGSVFTLPLLLVPPLSTGAHTVELEVQVDTSGGAVTETATEAVDYVSRANSPYGSGWGVSGVDQLVPTTGGVLWVDGDGDARLFAGTSTYTSPAGDYGTLVASGAGYTYTAYDGDVEVFNTAGEETALEYPTGPAWAFTYTAAKGLATVTAPDGGTTTFSYSGTSGLVSGIAEPGARALTLTETGTDLTGITDVDGSTRTLGYSGTSHLLDSDNWSPWVATFGYNTYDQVDAVDLGGGIEDYTIAPTFIGDPAVVTDGDGDVTWYELGWLGQLYTEWEPGDVNQTWSYTSGWQVSAFKDARNQTTSYTYASGLLTGVTNANGSTESYTYGAVDHDLSEGVDEDGDVTVYGYDAYGDVTSTTTGSGTTAAETTSNTWSGGLLMTSTDADGNVTTYGYNARDQVTSQETTAPGGAVIDDETFAYNGAGYATTNVVGVGATGAATTTFAYDGKGQLLGQTNPAGDTASYTYAAAGDVVYEADGDGVGTSYVYNGADEETEEIDDANQSVPETSTFTFDAAGNQTRVTDPLGNYTADTFNAEGLVLTQKPYNASGTQVGGYTYTYDADGDVVGATDGDQNVTYDQYDAVDRVAFEAVYSAAGGLVSAVSYVYDGDDNVVTMTDADDDATVYVYDADGNVATQVASASGTVLGSDTYTYDANNNVLTDRDGDGNVTSYTYAGNELVSMKVYAAGGALVTSGAYSFDRQGNEVSSTDALGNVTSYGYDGDDRLLSTVVKNAGGTTISSESSTFNNDGDDLTDTDALGNVTSYTYDDNDNVVSEVVTTSGGTWVSGASYAYDGDDNVVTETDYVSAGVVGTSTTSTYAPGGLVLTQKTYDGSGVRIGSVTNAYDGDGNVSQSTDADGNTTLYGYIDDDVVQEVVYNGSGVLVGGSGYGYDFAGNVTYSNVGGQAFTFSTYRGDELLSTTERVSFSSSSSVVSSGAYTYDQDGNVATETDALGNVTSYSYTGDELASETVRYGTTLAATTSYTYDGNQNVATVTDPNGNVTSYTYNGDNDVLSTVVKNAGGTTIRTDTDTYDGDDDKLTDTDADGNVTTNTYAGGRLTYTRTTDPSGTVIASTSYTYDGADNVLTATDALGNVTRDTYDGNRLVTETERYGTSLAATTSYTYDGDQNVATVTDPNGNVTSYTYSDDQVTSVVVKSSAGTTISTGSDQYDLNGDVTQSTDADGNVTSDAYSGGLLVYTQTTDSIGQLISSTAYTYDTDGNMLTETDALGNVTSYGYTGDRLSSETERSGTTLAATTSYTYDGDDNVATVKDPNGNVTSYTYNADGDVLSTVVKNAGGTTISSDTDTFDGDDDELTDTDADGNVTTNTYDGDRLTFTQTKDSSGHLIASTSYTYDADDNVLTETDALGNVTSYGYTGDRLATETERSGTTLAATTSYTYDGDNNTATVTDPNGNVTSYTYNADGDVLSTVVKNAGGTTISSDTATFDGDDNVLTETDADGNVISNRYDGNLLAFTQTTDSIGHLISSTSYTYDGDENVLTETDALGNVTAYTYTGDRLASETERSGTTLAATTSYTYDGDDNVLTVTDPNGNVTSYTYNGDNDVLSTVVKNSSGTTISSDTDTYDGDDNETTDTDADGNVTTNTYDGDRLTFTQTKDSSGHLIASTSYTYDADDNVLTETDALGNVTSYGYTGDRLATETERSGTTLAATTSYTYDGDNNTATVTDPNGNVTSYTYNADGDVLSTVVKNSSGTTISSDTDTYDGDDDELTETDADGNVTTNTYDGDLLTFTQTKDPSGHLIASTSYTYDGDENVLTETDALGNVTAYTYVGGRLATQTLGYGTSAAETTSYTYDGDNNVASITDPDGNTTSFTYNALGQVLTTTTPLGTTTNGYDGDGNLTSMKDPLGRTITYAYDGDQLSAETWYNSGGTVVDAKTYTYDTDGNMLTAGDGSGTYTWTYAGDRVVAQKDPNGITLSYAYNGDDEVTGVSDSQGGSTTQGYNADGLVTYKAYQNGAVQLRVNVGYDGDGDVTSEARYANAAGTGTAVGNSTFTYDGDEETGITATDATGSVVSAYGYTYTSDDELATQVANGTTTTYGYDAAGELTQSGSASYTYDANGNQTGTGYSTGTDNELSSDGTWRYTYDAVGNLTTQSGISNGVTWTYAYNDADQLTSVVETSGGTVVESARYGYDVLGNVLSETVTASGTATTSGFAYTDDGTLYADVVSGGTIGTRYIAGVGGADTWLARVTSSGGSWLLSDDEGSVTRVVGLTGGVQDAITYDAWGNITSETAPSLRGELGYQGGRSDTATGNWVFGAREYSSARHDWTTQDPSGFGGGDSNLGRFVNNAPTDGTDPSGLDPYRIDENGNLWWTTTIRSLFGDKTMDWSIGHVDGDSVDVNFFGGVSGRANLLTIKNLISQTNAAAAAGADRRIDQVISGKLRTAIADNDALVSAKKMPVAATPLPPVRLRFGASLTDGVTSTTTLGGDPSPVPAGPMPNIGKAAVVFLLTPDEILTWHSWFGGFSTLGQIPDRFESDSYPRMRGNPIPVPWDPKDDPPHVRSASLPFEPLLPGAGAFRGGTVARGVAVERAAVRGAAAERAAVSGVAKAPNCFAAGTPLLTPTGSKPIDQFVPGDLVLSRDEFDAEGVVGAKVVEEVFAQFGKVIEVHAGGQVISVTTEHPFWVLGKGWLPARELMPGDRLVGHDGQWVAVQKVVDADRWATVYNLRVADFHTYFVGDTSWGFSVWAHNLCYQDWLTKNGLQHSEALETLFKTAQGRTLNPAQAEQVLKGASLAEGGTPAARARAAAVKDLQIVELENLPKGRALTEADSQVLKDWLNGADGYGGRWGSKEVRELNHAWAGKYENEGWTVTNGAGRPSPKNPTGSEEFFKGPGKTDKTYVDITLTKNGKTMRVQTVDTLPDGVTLTDKEAAAAARIRGQFPNDELILVSKQTGKVIK